MGRRIPQPRGRQKRTRVEHASEKRGSRKEENKTCAFQLPKAKPIAGFGMRKRETVLKCAQSSSDGTRCGPRPGSLRPPPGGKGFGEHGGPDSGAQTSWRPRDRAAPSYSPPRDRPHFQAPALAQSAPPSGSAPPHTGRPGPRATWCHAPPSLGCRSLARRAPSPPPSRSLYLGLQPCWRPGQAGAGTA